MNPAELRDHCFSFTGAEETFPFGPNTSVFKVAGKMFALSQLAATPLAVSLKCEPGLAEALRELGKLARLGPGEGSRCLPAQSPPEQQREIACRAQTARITRLREAVLARLASRRRVVRQLLRRSGENEM